VAVNPFATAGAVWVVTKLVGNKRPSTGQRGVPPPRRRVGRTTPEQHGAGPHGRSALA